MASDGPDIANLTRSSTGGCQGGVVDELGWVVRSIRVYTRVVIWAVVAAIAMVTQIAAQRIFFLTFLSSLFSGTLCSAATMRMSDGRLVGNVAIENGWPCKEALLRQIDAFTCFTRLRREHTK